MGCVLRCMNNQCRDRYLVQVGDDRVWPQWSSDFKVIWTSSNMYSWSMNTQSIAEKKLTIYYSLWDLCCSPQTTASILSATAAMYRHVWWQMLQCLAGTRVRPWCCLTHACESSRQTPWEICPAVGWDLPQAVPLKHMHSKLWDFEDPCVDEWLHKRLQDILNKPNEMMKFKWSSQFTPPGMTQQIKIVVDIKMLH